MTAAKEAPTKSSWLAGVLVLNHISLTAIRVCAALQAIQLGGSSFEVGIVVALFAVLPALVSVPMGRATDRGNPPRLMLQGSIGVAFGAALPAISQSLPFLYLGAAIIGLSFLRFHLAVQTATGQAGDAIDRTRRFSTLALGFSTSSFIGPLLAGLLIDHAGYRVAFATIAVFPLAAVALVLRHPDARRAHPPAETAGASPRIVDLLLDRNLRFPFLTSAVIAMAWDLHAFFVPIYGTQVGLSASQSGAILSSFAAATFLVRLALTRFAARVPERTMLKTVMALASGVFFLYPLTESPLLLATLSFVLGSVLGSGQPLSMSLIHQASPSGRVGEANGVRQFIVNGMQVAVPLVFGAVGTATGMAPLFWTVGGVLVTGSWMARGRARRR